MKTTMNQAYMARMAQLMSQALESPEGMRALAAAIAAPIEQEIARKEISSLLLTQHTLPGSGSAVSLCFQERKKKCRKGTCS